MPATIGAGDTAINKADKILAVVELVLLGEGTIKTKL